MSPRRLDFNSILIHHLDPDHVNISIPDSGLFLSANLPAMGISRPIESDLDLLKVAAEIADRAAKEFFALENALIVHNNNLEYKEKP